MEEEEGITVPSFPRPANSFQGSRTFGRPDRIRRSLLQFPALREESPRRRPPRTRARESVRATGSNLLNRRRESLDFYARARSSNSLARAEIRRSSAFPKRLESLFLHGSR